MDTDKVDTLDYLTDEQLLAQIKQCEDREDELDLAMIRNEHRRCRLTGALAEREIRKLQ